MLDTLSSIPGIGTIVKWIGANVFGVTDAPNVRIIDWKTIETVDDPRRAWYHWLHVRCVNEQRTGRSRWMRTKTADGCHARVDFKRSGEGEQVVWWDYVPFSTGGSGTIQTADLIAGDRRYFVPLFLNLPSAVPNPVGTGTIGPGLFPTGNQFFGGVGKPLPAGSYSVTVSIYRGDSVLAKATMEGAVVASQGKNTADERPSSIPSDTIADAERRGANRQRIDDVAGRVLEGTASVSELIATAHLPVLLTWGGSMAFKGISDSPKMLSGVKCVLVNAQRWLPNQRAWGTSGDTHPGGVFQMLELTGKYDMHCQQGVAFGSLANEHHRLSIQGHPLIGSGLDYCRITTSAKWRLDFRIEDVSGRSVEHSLCFQWDGEGKMPKPFENCSNAEWEV